LWEKKEKREDGSSGGTQREKETEMKRYETERGEGKEEGGREGGRKRERERERERK